VHYGLTPPQILGDSSVTRQQVEQLFRTKRGLHEFLTLDCEFFLPPVKCTNIEWLKAIWKGNKKVSVFIVKKDLFMTIV